MINASDVIEYYQYFYSKKFDSPKYVFKPSLKAVHTIESFLANMKQYYPSMGRKFLWRFFIFQFNYWEDLEIEAFYGKYRIDLIVGPKAFKRWRERNQDFDGQIDRSEIPERYDIRYTELVDPIQSVPIRYPYEEDIKNLHFNTEKGFVTCIQFTTLYDDQQLTCTKCQFQQDCKKLLQQNYPQLYERRGYTEN